MDKLDHTSGWRNWRRGVAFGVWRLAFGVLVLVLVLDESGALARIGLMGPMGLIGCTQVLFS